MVSAYGDITPAQMAREIQIDMCDDGDAWTSTIGIFLSDNTDADGEILLSDEDQAAVRMLAHGMTTEVYIGGGSPHSAMFVLRVQP